MANEDQLKRLTDSIAENNSCKSWNEWRKDNKDVSIDLEMGIFSCAHLKGADLCGARMNGADFSRANLVDADLSCARLSGANFSSARLSGAELNHSDLDHANFSGANLPYADLNTADLSHTDLSKTRLDNTNLIHANLSHADLRKALMMYANLRYAHLDNANLSEARLDYVNLSQADLFCTDFSGAFTKYTVFANVDLSQVKEGCLEKIKHNGPSSVSTDTFINSKWTDGNLPREFLIGCGIPETFVSYIPSLVASVQPLQFYSIFISYCSSEEELAKRLHSKLKEHGLRVWFAPENLKAGEYVDEQLDKAIHSHEKLLVLLSPESIESKWVRFEIKRAYDKQEENKNGEKVLFPLRSCNFQILQDWKYIHPNSPPNEEIDIAKTIRRFFIPDFSDWENEDKFDESFNKLLEDLKKEVKE